MPDTVFWPDFSMHFSQRRIIPYHALFQVQQKIKNKKHSRWQSSSIE